MLRSPCPAVPPRPRSTRSSTGSTSAAASPGLRTVGRKALATALSDLAAMGAEPGEAYVGARGAGRPRRGGPPRPARRAARARRATGTTLAGGDVTRAPALTLAVTVVGHAASAEDFVTRSGAQPGDALVLTGEIGAAAAGRLLLDDPSLAAAVSGETAARLRARQLDPTPRLRSGRALAAAGREGDDRPQRRARRRRRPPRPQQRRRARDRSRLAAAGEGSRRDRGGGRARPAPARGCRRRGLRAARRAAGRSAADASLAIGERRKRP